MSPEKTSWTRLFRQPEGNLTKTGMAAIAALVLAGGGIAAASTVAFGGGSSPAIAGEVPAEEAEGREDEGERSAGPERLRVNTEALATLKLSYAKAEHRPLAEEVEVPATLEPVPDRRATVGPRVAGRVVQVDVNIGDQVKRGAPLVVLESVDVGRARADAIAAQARLKVARRAAERARMLRDEGISSERSVEQAEGALEVARAEVAAVRARLAAYGVGRSTASRSGVASVVLTSPIAGTVVARSVHVGQWVEPSTTIVEVVDLDELWLEGAIYERDLAGVAVGQAVRVEVRAIPNEPFSGVVEHVGDTVDERSRSITIRVSLPNLERRLKPGMFATARIQGTSAEPGEQALVIPRAAVQEIDEHNAAFVRLGDGEFELRRVHTGRRAGDLVEVLNGIKAGEEVVVEGSFQLKGQLLRSTLGEDE